MAQGHPEPLLQETENLDNQQIQRTHCSRFRGRRQQRITKQIVLFAIGDLHVHENDNPLPRPVRKTAMGNWTTLDTPHGQVTAWHTTPSGTPRGGLVVIQEIFGANEHIRQVAEDFAAQGYEVLAPSFFDLIEKDLQLPYDNDGVKRGLELVGQIGVDKAVDVVKAAAATLAQALESPHQDVQAIARDSHNVGTVGYCWGGTIALLSATRLDLPSVSYYGGRNTQFLDEAPKAPVMFHFGEQDKSIPPEAVQQHREKLPQMEVFTYPADHAFNRSVGHNYEPESARLARERTLRFLAEQLA
jgi:carboxymethylenebutenolidase